MNINEGIREALKSSAVAKTSVGSDEHVDEVVNALREQGLSVYQTGETQRLRNKLDYANRKIREFENAGDSGPNVTQSYQAPSEQTEDESGDDADSTDD